MNLRVLVVPDKFKCTLTANQAAAAIAAGWAASRPGDILDTLPMSDGGDGFGEVLGDLLQAERRQCATIDCAGRARTASWWFAPNTHTAIVETAQVNGMYLLPQGQYHPFELDTFGIGALMNAATQSAARRIYIGLGGSATNDGGFGLARALGWSFLDEEGRELRSWTDLVRLAHLRRPPTPLVTAGHEVTIAVDVTNPLLGPSGATRVFGRQKGLTASDTQRAEACLCRLAEVGRNALGHDVALEPGSGAAGGLGFGLRAFAGGHFQPGASVFATEAHLERRITQSDLVITGEGRFDEQSLMGKGVGMVAAACARAGKRCVCLAGSLEALPADLPRPGISAFSVVPTLTDLQQSTLHAAHWLQRLAADVAARL